MIVIAVLLIVIAVVLTAAAITSNGGSTKFDLWGTVHSTMSVGTVFLMGMITTVIGVVGIVLLLGGMRRGRRLRKERKRIAKEHEQLTGTSLGAGGGLGDTGLGTGGLGAGGLGNTGTTTPGAGSAPPDSR